jgi:hypothetical protein
MPEVPIVLIHHEQLAHYYSTSSSSIALSHTMTQLLCSTRAGVFPDGQKPSGKCKKPTEIIFLTGSRQESTDRNSSTGMIVFSCRPAVKQLFLTAVPDGLHLPSQN